MKSLEPLVGGGRSCQETKAPTLLPAREPWQYCQLSSWPGRGEEGWGLWG